MKLNKNSKELHAYSVANITLSDPIMPNIIGNLPPGLPETQVQMVGFPFGLSL